MKAAAETWVRAIGHGFRARPGEEEQTAAAVIFVVTSLDGLEAELANEVVNLWDTPAADAASPQHL